jgi:hypothetical protein
VKEALFDVPPPGPGFETVTGTVPAAVRSEPGRLTVSDVGDWDTTGSPIVPNITIEEDRKFVPAIVRLMVDDPATRIDGDSPVTVGVGLMMTGAVAVKLTTLETAFPGLLTATVTLPGVDGTVTNAVNVPAFTNVVPTALPLKTIVAPLTKVEPFTVSWIDAPVSPDSGEMSVTAGVGAATFNTAPVEGPPPGP